MSDYTPAQLAAIKRAFASGVTRVTYEGKTTEYRSLRDMQVIIATIEADLKASATGRPRANVSFATFRRS